MLSMRYRLDPQIWALSRYPDEYIESAIAEVKSAMTRKARDYIRISVDKVSGTIDASLDVIGPPPETEYNER